MEAKHAMQMRDGEGRLPAVAPLANPYVPFQQENAAKYDAKKGEDDETCRFPSYYDFPSLFVHKHVAGA